MIAIGSTPNLSAVDQAQWVASMKPISDFLRAAGDLGTGVIRVPTTNDINWATVARPGGGLPAVGHDIFRFNDDLQAASPLFIKVQYGQGATNTPALFITLGTAIDAAGNFTGVLISTTKQLCPAVAAAATWPLFLSHGPSHFSFCQAGLAATSSQASMQCYIERMRDDAGIETPDGFIMLFGGGSTFPQRVQAMPASGVAVPADALATVHLPAIGGMAGITVSGEAMVLAPIAVPHNGEWRYMTAMVYRNGDISHGVTIQKAHLGDIRKYLALGGVLAGQKWNSPDSSAGILARWE